MIKAIVSVNALLPWMLAKTLAKPAKLVNVDVEQAAHVQAQQLLLIAMLHLVSVNALKMLRLAVSSTDKPVAVEYAKR